MQRFAASCSPLQQPDPTPRSSSPGHIHRTHEPLLRSAIRERSVGPSAVLNGYADLRPSSNTTSSMPSGRGISPNSK